MQTTQPNPAHLPKSFSLLPFADGSLQVNLASRALGYIWPSDDSWHARNTDGDRLDAGTCLSVQAAVAVVFESCDEFALS